METNLERDNPISVNQVHLACDVSRLKCVWFRRSLPKIDTLFRDWLQHAGTDTLCCVVQPALEPMQSVSVDIEIQCDDITDGHID